MSTPLSRLARIGAAVALAVAAPIAAGSFAAADEGYQIRAERVDTSTYPVVRVVASVVDGSGKPVRGLTREDLVLAEDGTRMPTRVDLASESNPVALAFVLDASGSMAGGPLQQAVTATITMLQRLGPRDEAAIIAYRAGATVVQPLTADKAAVAAAAQSLVAAREVPIASWEGFHDALAKGGEALRTAPLGSRGAMVLVTDGFAPGSTPAQLDLATARARASLYPINTIAVGAQADRATFQGIAAASGGQAFFAPTPTALAAAYSALSEQILTQYTISYTTARPGQPGEGRTLKLDLVRGGSVIASTSLGYAVPTAGLAAAAPASAPTILSAGQSATVVAGSGAVTLGEGPSTSLSAGAAIAALAPKIATDPAAAVAVLGAAAAFSIVLFFWNGVLGAARVATRLDKFVPTPNLAGGLGEPRRPLRDRYVRPALSTLGRKLTRFTPAAMLASSGRQLEQAGSPLGMGPVEFLGLRAGTALLCGGLAFLFSGLSGAGPELVIGGPLGSAVLGFLIPSVLISRTGGARKKMIVRVMPSTLDMIALSVEAGLAFDGAIAQVVQRRQNPLADEFRRLLVEFQMGRPRKEALREVARRTGVNEVSRFMNAVMQADALGAPLGKVLSDLAAELRARKRQRAEEAARKAPIKMMFPMVGLIFPALFVVILGPAVPRLMSIFGSVTK